MDIFRNPSFIIFTVDILYFAKQNGYDENYECLDKLYKA